jgi:hypothetical protein
MLLTKFNILAPYYVKIVTNTCFSLKSFLIDSNNKIYMFVITNLILIIVKDKRNNLGDFLWGK